MVLLPTTTTTAVQQRRKIFVVTALEDPIQVLKQVEEEILGSTEKRFALFWLGTGRVSIELDCTPSIFGYLCILWHRYSSSIICVIG